MIINNGVQEKAEVIGNIDTSNSMRMNLNAQSYELLLSNLYSDPLGSTIRELSTNAVEANQNSGTTKKVVLQLPNALSTDLIIKDYGTGLNDKEIDKYLNCLFSSSKGESNDSMGGFGLGSKSPLALVDSFYLSSVKDGVQYDYMWIKERGQIPTPIFQGSDKVNKENGITITVPLGSSSKIPLYNLSSTVRQSVNRQLFGFKDLVRIVEDASVKYEDMVDVTDKVITWKPVLDLPSISLFEKKEDTNSYRRTGNNYDEFYVRVGTVVYRYNASHTVNLNWIRSYIRNPYDFVVVINVPIGKLDIPMSREEINTTSDNATVISSITAKAEAEIKAEYKKIPFDFDVGAVKFQEQLQSYSNNSSLVYNISADPASLEKNDTVLLNKICNYVRSTMSNASFDVNHFVTRVNVQNPLYDYIDRLSSFLTKSELKVTQISSSGHSAVSTNIRPADDRIYLLLPSKLPYGVRVSDLLGYVQSKHPTVKDGVTLIQYKTDYAKHKELYSYFKEVLEAIFKLKGFTSVFAAEFDEADAKDYVKKQRAVSKGTVLPNDFLVGVRCVLISSFRNEFNKRSNGSFTCGFLTNSDHRIRLNKRLDDKGKAIPLGPEYLDSKIKTVFLTDSTEVPLISDSSYNTLKDSEVKANLEDAVVIKAKDTQIELAEKLFKSKGYAVYTKDNPYKIVVPTLEDSLLVANPDEVFLEAMDTILTNAVDRCYMTQSWRSDSNIIRKRLNVDLDYFENNFADKDNVYYKHIVSRRDKIIKGVIDSSYRSQEYNYNEKAVAEFSIQYQAHVIDNLKKDMSFWLKDGQILNSNCYTDSTAKALFKNFGYDL